MIKRLLLLVMVFPVMLVGCRRGASWQTTFHAGIRALEQGRYDQSIRLFQQSLSVKPGGKQEAVIYNCVGIAYSRLGQRDAAVQAFETSMELDPGLVDPIYNVGVLMGESGSQAKAIACFEKASLVDTNETQSLEYVGYLCRQERQWDQARRALNEALARGPRSPRVLTALAVLDLQTGDVEKAISGFQMALEHDSRYLPAIYNLGIVNERWLKNSDQARPYFEEYARLSSQGPYADKARRALNDIGSNMATLKLEQSGPGPLTEAGVARAPAAEGQAEIRDRASTDRVPSSSPGFDELMKMAGILEKQGRIDAAVNNYLRSALEAERAGDQARQEGALRAAVEACGDNARAHYAVGEYFFEHKRNVEAMAHFKRAVGLDENWGDAYVALALTAVKEGEFDTAVVCLKQADRSQPDKPDALWSLAQLYDESLSLTNQAVQCYTGFIRRFPADARAATSRERLKALGGR